MLYPTSVALVTRQIRQQNLFAKIYMYTAKVDDTMAALGVLQYLDGITLTLHEQYDVAAFQTLDDLLVPPIWGGKEKSLRLNVFDEVNIDGIDTSNWIVKDHIEWIEDCPVPPNEVLMRWWK